MQQFTVTAAAAAIRSLMGDRAAALHLATQAIETASFRTVLHGDTSLFRSMSEAAEGKRGAAAKALLGRILAAESAAREAAKIAFAGGRKGTASKEQINVAESMAAPIAASFLEACKADAEGRSTTAKAGAAKAAETRAAKGKDASLEATTAPAGDVVAVIMARGAEYAQGVLTALAAAIAAQAEGEGKVKRQRVKQAA